MPAAAIGAKVIKIPENDLGRAITGPNNDTDFPWHMELGDHVITNREQFDALAAGGGSYTGRPVFPAVEGVAVFTRPDPQRASLALVMAGQGIPTVAEADDLYLAPASQNLFTRQQGADEATRDWHARAMVSFPRCVFSTAWLRDRYHQEFRARFRAERKAGHRLPELFVCRNNVPRNQWPAPIPREGPLRVGFMGSPSHVWDVNLIWGAFDLAKKMGCETWMVGYNPADPDPDHPDHIELEDGTIVHHRSQESRDVIAKWKTVVDHGVRWIKPEEYHRVAIPFDIGLAPLQYNQFTSGKSDVKMIEYAISGAVGVCAALPAYNLAGWKHEVNCLMANSDQEYGEQLHRLIKDPLMRKDLLAAAQDMVFNERCEVQLKAEWSDALGLDRTLSRC